MPSTPDLADRQPAAAPPGTSRAFRVRLCVISFALSLGLITFIQSLLPRMSETVAGSGGKQAALGVVLGVGVIGGLVGNPIFGILSDRTVSRFGRRRPWIVFGAVAGAALMVLLPRQSSVLSLTIAWLAVQFVVNASLVAVAAAIPDQVPVAERGALNGWIGLSQALGVIAGLAVVSTAAPQTTQGSWVIAGLMAVVVLAMTAGMPDSVSAAPAAEQGEASLAQVWAGLRAAPDFLWVWAARFLFSLGVTLTFMNFLFFLTDRVGFTERDALNAHTMLLGVYLLTSMVTGVIAGTFSDRFTNRTAYLKIGASICALAALSLAVSSSLTPVTVAAVALGVGYGLYIAVDQALITQVLPDAEHNGRALGVFNIAASVPQMIGPAISSAAFLAAATATGYAVLFVAAAVSFAGGGVLIARVTTIR